ncbi:MAG: DNA repair protein RadA [Spirochaetia bacterium]
MAKSKTMFICSECGTTQPKWLGRCPSCGEWNTFTEHSSGKGSSGGSAPASTVKLSDVDTGSIPRKLSGIQELDRVLGGGIFPGSSILVGGEPGIGKSTLMLQLSCVSAFERILYVSGEESAGQIGTRAKRLNLDGRATEILCTSELDEILNTLRNLKPGLAVIDSIQTVQSAEAGPIAGSPNQIKYCCQNIIQEAKNLGTSLFLIAHVTKEGAIAGPKVIEHLVDTVLYFEQSESETRFLRANKNRFGSVDEIGLFTMESSGLVPVQDPSSLFLVKRKGTDADVPPGIIAAPVYEGSRILLVELQALTISAKGGISRVFSDKIDSRRVSRMAAVLEKHAGIRLSDQDIYVNVAGGIKIQEVGVELPLAMAIYSARSNIPIPKQYTVAGELSLAGEIRPISHLRRRVRTAAEMGFSRFLGPASCRKGDKPEDPWLKAATVSEAIRQVFKQEGQ